MILLTSAKMPDGLDKHTLASAVGLMFPKEENREYLANRKGALFRFFGGQGCVE